MTRTKAQRRLTWAALFLSPVSFAMASPQATDPIPVASVDPTVPAAAGTPCVIVLFRNQSLYADTAGSPGLGFSYAPPPGCPGPWAKVILKLDLSADWHVDTPDATLRLAGRPIFQGAMPDFAGGAIWHAERDLTDIASVFKGSHRGQFFAERGDDGSDNSTPLVATAQLFFYRSSSATPAQSSPDGVYRIGPAPTSLELPQNIVRAYLDVYNAAPWWFTCVPAADSTKWPLTSDLAPGDQRQHGFAPPGEGCLGGSFGEIQVSIDGAAAGIAPYYPRLSPDANYYYQGTLEVPAPSLQRLDITPFRVDLTPFAAVLNRAGTHTIALNGRIPVDAQLLLYQNKSAAHVTGAVILNTLVGSNATPTVSDTLTESNDMVQGDITTELDRQFHIEGYVNTSRGRIYATVSQASQFLNVQRIVLDGLTWPQYRAYQQHLKLTSVTQQHSRRTLNGSVLSDDTYATSFPLEWNYDMTGKVSDTEFGLLVYPSAGQVSASQGRNVDSTQKRAGLSYQSHLRDSFSADHTRDLDARTDGPWQSFVERYFWDNRGTCREAALSTANGVQTSAVSGDGCPNGVNHTTWFAHPDGSPDGLGWFH